jgi:hypothetical protein
MEPLNDDYRRWTIQMWTGLREGQVWAIPRSQSAFQKRGEQLVFLWGSESEFQVVRSHFENIGVEVVRDGL